MSERGHADPSHPPPSRGSAAAAPEARRGRFAMLLATLVFVTLAAPAQHLIPHGPMLFRAALGGTLSAGLYQISQSRRLFLVGLALTVPAIIGGALSSFEHSPLFDACALALAACFLALVGVYVLRAVLLSGRVDIDSLLGGVSGYLLLVALFALLHTLTEHLAPGSYLEHGAPIQRSDGALEAEVLTSTMQYFSAVTATTLGYGDVVPVGAVARLLVSFEAILGQLYITILLAGLVSSLVSRRDAGPPRGAGDD
jgi:hypothetical protein